MKKIIQILEEFSFSENEAITYTELLKHSWITVLALSRHTNIKRTTLYRVLEKLADEGFVERKITKNTTYYRAGESSSFNLALARQKDQTAQLEKRLPALRSLLDSFQIDPDRKTEVNYFMGKKGLQQLEWRIAHKTNNACLRVFGSDEWPNIVGSSFAENIRSVYVQRNITVKEILNFPHVGEGASSQQTNWTDNTAFSTKYHQARRISKAQLPIDDELMIIDDTIALHSIDKHELVAVEIKNAVAARLLANLFELAWNQATPDTNYV